LPKLELSLGNEPSFFGNPYPGAGPMLNLDLTSTKIYLRPGYTDGRKQINGLAALVRDQFLANPLDGSLYLFCGLGGRRLKILYWDRNGFCLWMKRLEEDRFPWPKSPQEVQHIQRWQLELLLQGIDFRKAHPVRNYQYAG